MQHFRCDGPEQQGSKCAVAVGRHHDEVDSVLVGEACDDAGWIAQIGDAVDVEL